MYSATFKRKYSEQNKTELNVKQWINEKQHHRNTEEKVFISGTNQKTRETYMSI